MNNLQDVFSEKFLSELDRFANVGFVVQDYPLGKIVYCNETMGNIYGYDRDFFLEKGLDAFISLTHPEDAAKMAIEMAGFVKEILDPEYDRSGIKMRTMTGRQQHKKGHWIWTELNPIVVTFTPEGQPGLILACVKDISKQKSGEEFLMQELLKREPSEIIQKELLQRYEELTSILNENNILEEGSDITLRMNPIRILSDREKEILKLISKGLSSKEIADELKISFHTAEKHRKNILQKFEVKNTAELIKEAGRSYWLGN